MIVLTFEAIQSKYNVDNKALSKIKIQSIDRGISWIPIEIVMTDQTSETNNATNFKIIFNLHPTDVAQLVLVMRRNGGETVKHVIF